MKLDLYEKLDLLRKRVNLLDTYQKLVYSNPKKKRKLLKRIRKTLREIEKDIKEEEEKKEEEKEN